MRGVWVHDEVVVLMSAMQRLGDLTSLSRQRNDPSGGDYCSVCQYLSRNTVLFEGAHWSLTLHQWGFGERGRWTRSPGGLLVLFHVDREISSHTTIAEVSQIIAERKLKASAAFHRPHVWSPLKCQDQMLPQGKWRMVSTRTPKAANQANEMRMSTRFQ